MKAKTIIIMMMIMLLGLCSFASASNPFGLTSDWEHDNIDVSGVTSIDAMNNYNGTINSATTGVSGIIGEAFGFDGLNDYVEMPNNAIFRRTGDFSVGCWINPLSATTTDSYIFGSDLQAGTEGWGLFLDGNGAGVYTFRVNTDGADVVNSISIGENGKWVHIVGVHNDSENKIYIYINGTAENSAAVGTPQYNGNFPFSIGYRDSTNDYFFNGSIDQCFYTTEALSPTKVNDIFTHGKRLDDGQKLDITAKDYWNQSSILNFSAIVNGIPFSTTNGTINTNITLNGSLSNMTISATGYQDRIVINRPLTENYLAWMWRPINLYIYAYDFLGNNLIQSTWIWENHTGTNLTSNPFSRNITNYINTTITSRNIRVRISDKTYIHTEFDQILTISNTTSNISINMTPNRLVLNFSDATTGVIMQSDMGNLNFSNSTIVIIQQNLSEGMVNVKFNEISGNFTQFYDYYNDYTTNINEDIKLLNYSNWYDYFKVIDKSNSPIEGADIRGYFSIVGEYYSNWSEHKLFGRRMTDYEGYTFFNTDYGTILHVTITADGYNPAEVMYQVGDETWDKDNPYLIVLEESDSGVDRNVFISVKKEFRNRSLDISGYIVAPNYYSVRYLTTYAESTGLSQIEIAGEGTDIEDSQFKSPFTLESGIDFEDTGNNNITMMIFLNNLPYKNITITYDKDTKTEMFSTDDIAGASKQTRRTIIWLIILVACGGLGYAFRNQELSVNAFKGGCVIFAIIEPCGLTLTLASLTILGYLVPMGMELIRE